MENIEKIFTEIGGSFLTPPVDISKKLGNIKALVFDWDGVFNKGEKEGGGSSPFSEVDSMGTNLLRFSYWLKNQNLPKCAIISGEKNQTAFWFGSREHFTANYFKVPDKTGAINHFCETNSIHPSEIAFFMDDVLDLSIAQIAGLRILVNRNANPLFKKYVKENNLADYITGAESGNFAVREGCELLMGLIGNEKEAFEKRISYDQQYKNYLAERNKAETQFFSKDNEGKIVATSVNL